MGFFSSLWDVFSQAYMWWVSNCWSGKHKVSGLFLNKIQGSLEVKHRAVERERWLEPLVLHIKRSFLWASFITFQAKLGPV